MTNETKRRAIIFLILAVLITVLLAVALPQLNLQQGVPLPGAGGNSQTKITEQGAVEEPSPAVGVNTFLEAFLGLFLLMVLVYLLTRRRKRLNRKDLAKILSELAMVSLVLSFIMFAASNININLTPAAAEILPGEVAVAVGPPLAPLPATLLWLVWIALGGLALVLVLLLVRVRIRQPGQRDPLALEAEQAVEAIKSGQDFSNVILRCYRQMSQVLKKEQGLVLEETMTAREFEALLEKRGVPNPPVRQLTRLFEIARYASQAPGPAEEAQAVDCLNAIAQYSLKKKPR